MADDPQELALLVVGGIGPMFLLAHSLLSRKRAYAGWAKLAYALASLAGLAWGTIGFVVLNPFHVTRNTYSLLLAIKYISAGIAIGFMLSVLIARPYRRRTAINPQADVTTRT